ncbi:hypothetical protein ACI01nite_23110 [Acetobacter cibinongensis]|uniref:Transposase n=1 Tax=Acetobacter cibinongensis TaxID=146475 RepID=A0A0D6N680_9PROT|nr:transposase [Acetobacter cibinongensis]GEL59709.1 hypothetical protein ACI01nite_23110 [Acetobacter cibinongensis]
MYGVGDVERTLRWARIGYVLGVKSDYWFGSWATDSLIAGEAKNIAAALSENDWRRLPAAHILRWSVFRRTHQANAMRSQLRHKMQL